LNITLTKVIASTALVTAPMLAFADHHEETTKMSTAERHEVHHECERLINKFLRHFEREHAKAADLFTEDGQALGNEGREAIREAFSQFDARDVEVNVLISSNILIDIEKKDHAKGACYVMHYQYAHPDSKREGQPELQSPKSITRWIWEFTHVDGKWYISKLDDLETVMLRKDLLHYESSAPESEPKK